MTGELFFWLADNMTLWTRSAVMVLAAFVIGLCHAVAILTADGRG